MKVQFEPVAKKIEKELQAAVGREMVDINNIMSKWAYEDAQIIKKYGCNEECVDRVMTGGW